MFKICIITEIYTKLDMRKEEIILKIKKAITKLYDEDGWLIEKDLSEQSISHRLAIYVQENFAEYNVDCEYNGDGENIYNRKRIEIVKQTLREKRLLREKEELDVEKEFTERAVFPDIIIHMRGTNESNLCIIEIKKSTSRVEFHYDEIKLKCYTSDESGNHLKYGLGVFIEFVTHTNERIFNSILFENGVRSDYTL